VPYDALCQAASVLDGLTRALDHVARYGPGFSASAAQAESVNLYEAPLRGFYRVVASVFWGGLIQVLAGISGGSGGLLTKRSGWAA
jgi:hypothetical protein